jgi:hypothetical protein
MNNDIRKLIDDNWDEIKELVAQKAKAEQKSKTIWDFNTNDRNSYYYIDEVGCLRLESLRKYSRPFKSGEYNYVVMYDTENNMLLVRVAQFHNSGGPVFANKEVAEKAIDEIGKVRLKKYWFGVKYE